MPGKFAQNGQIPEAMEADFADMVAERILDKVFNHLDSSLQRHREQLLKDLRNVSCGDSPLQQTAGAQVQMQAPPGSVVPETMDLVREVSNSPAPLDQVCAPDAAPQPMFILPEEARPGNVPETVSEGWFMKKRSSVVGKNEKMEAAEKGRQEQARRMEKSTKEMDDVELIRDQYRCGMCRQIMTVAASTKFEVASIVLIVLNTMYNGIEVQILSSGTNSYDTDVALHWIGSTFNVMFLIELCLRFLAHGVSLLWGSDRWWIRFDAIIVIFGLLETAILIAGEGLSVNPGVVRIVRLLKIMRVLRVVRVVHTFRGLRILVLSIAHSVRNGIWVVLVLFASLWSFGTVFTLVYLDVLNRDEPVDPALVKNFGSLVNSIYTLFASLFGGIDWDVAIQSLNTIQPSWPMKMLFMLFIASQYLCLINVITGVFCQGAMESASKDHDMVISELLTNKQQYVTQLQRLWKTLDKDGHGSLTLDDWEGALEDDSVKLYLEGLGISVSDAWGLFSLLADEETRMLEPETFLEGCLKLNGNARAVDIAALEKKMEEHYKHITEAVEEMGTKLLKTGSADILGSRQASTGH